MVRMNLQFFGGRGSGGGRRQEERATSVKNNIASKLAGKEKPEFEREGEKKESKKSAKPKSGTFDDGRTPSQVKVGEELRAGGVSFYKAASNKWAIHENGASFSSNDKFNAALYSRLRNSDIKRMLTR